MSDQTVSCSAQVLELTFSVSRNQQEMYFKCLMFVCTWRSLPQTCPVPLFPRNHYRPANNKSSCFTFRCTLGLKYWKTWRKIRHPTEQTVPVWWLYKDQDVLWAALYYLKPYEGCKHLILQVLTVLFEYCHFWVQITSEVVHTLHMAEPKVELLSQHQSVVHKEASGRHFSRSFSSSLALTLSMSSIKDKQESFYAFYLCIT